MEKCPHETNIGRLEKIIYGNGHKGLIENINRLDENVKVLIKTNEKLDTSVSALTQFMGETKGAKNEKQVTGSTIRWLIGVFITMSVAYVTTMAAILLK